MRKVLLCKTYDQGRIGEPAEDTKLASEIDDVTKKLLKILSLGILLKSNGMYVTILYKRGLCVEFGV